LVGVQIVTAASVMHYKGYSHKVQELYDNLQHLTAVAMTAVPVHTIKACGGVDIHIH